MGKGVLVACATMVVNARGCYFHSIPSIIDAAVPLRTQIFICRSPLIRRGDDFFAEFGRYSGIDDIVAFITSSL